MGLIAAICNRGPYCRKIDDRDDRHRRNRGHHDRRQQGRCITIFWAQKARNGSISLKQSFACARQTAAPARQRSVAKFSFRTRGNLRRTTVGVTIRHSCGAKQWTAALRSWTGETANPFKTKPIVATGASFPRFRHTRATFGSVRRRRPTRGDTQAAKVELISPADLWSSEA